MLNILAVSDVSAAGGAGQLFRRTNEVLTQAGHSVTTFTEDSLPDASSNSTLAQMFRQRNQKQGVLQTLLLKPALEHAVWAGRSIQRVYYPTARRQLRALLTQQSFDVAHVHNLHSRLSLDLLTELVAANIPTVMQVNDYYFFCNNHYAYNMTLRRPCKLCIEGDYRHALRYGCSSHMNTGHALYDYFGRLLLEKKNPWRAIDMYLVTSEDSARRLDDWGISRERQYKILNPMELGEFEVPVSVGERFIFYGNEFIVKGTELFLQALEHVAPGTKIGVYLMRMSTDYRQRLEDVVQRQQLDLHCDPEIRWHTGLREIVAQARAIVSPSQWWVPSENVVYEALLLGKPVINSRIGGNTEIIDEGVTGLFFNPQDAPGLAACINRLAEDRQLAEQMSENAYRIAREKFAPQKFLKNIETAYEKTITLAQKSC